MTPTDIEQLFQSRESHTGPDDELSEPELEYRTSRLREVLTEIENAWQNGSEEIDLIAQKIGDGCRDASWRVPIGKSGILDFFLTLLAEDTRPALKIQTLRIVGNSCADTDENRARVVQSGQITALVGLFRQPGPLMPFLGPVVYNVCVDYEPAQLELSKAGLSKIIIESFSTPAPTGDVYGSSTGIICKILGILAAQASELETADPTTPGVLLQLATNLANPDDMEDFCSLVAAALAYLAHDRFQIGLIESGDASYLFSVYAIFYRGLGMMPTDSESVEAIQATFLNLLADVSAHPEFEQICSGPHDADIVARLIKWLQIPNAHLQTAGALCLGNLARSDETSTALLARLQQPITRLFSTTTTTTTSNHPSSSSPTLFPSGQTLYAVLSFLKNLAIPVANKPILGRILFPAVIAHIWSTTTTQPQTLFAAISLTRLLLTNCGPENIRLSISPPSPSPSLDLSTEDETSSSTTPTLLHLLSQTIAAADAEPTKFEGGRAILAVCKALHSPNTADRILSDEQLSTFYANHREDIATSLTTLLSQGKFPALRSEALFVMALMARSADGAKVVAEVIGEDAVLDVLGGIVGGREKGLGEGKEEAQAVVVRGTEGGDMDGIVEGLGLEQPGSSRQVADPALVAGVAKADRENGLVLVAELLKQDEIRLLGERRAVLEGMLRTGGEMVVSERQGTA